MNPGPASSSFIATSKLTRRRGVLYGCLALGAAAAGAGASWWRSQQPQQIADGSAAPDSLWATSFETPGGASIAMRTMRGKPLLINFWATWCPPCVEELPLIDAFFRQNSAKSWQVLGLAIDQPSAVRSFLNRIPVGFPVGLAGLDGTDLGRALGNVDGALPFTVVLGANGRVLRRKLGRLSPQELSGWATIPGLLDS